MEPDDQYHNQQAQLRIQQGLAYLMKNRLKQAEKHYAEWAKKEKSDEQDRD